MSAPLSPIDDAFWKNWNITQECVLHFNPLFLVIKTPVSCQKQHQNYFAINQCGNRIQFEFIQLVFPFKNYCSDLSWLPM